MLVQGGTAARPRGGVGLLCHSAPVLAENFGKMSPAADMSGATMTALWRVKSIRFNLLLAIEMVRLRRVMVKTHWLCGTMMLVARGARSAVRTRARALIEYFFSLKRLLKRRLCEAVDPCVRLARYRRASLSAHLERPCGRALCSVDLVNIARVR